MKLKMFAAAALLSLSAAPALAVPLNSVGGLVDWKLTGLTTESATWVGTNESTWGIGTVTSMQRTGQPLNTVWSSVAEGQYLNYMMYGISDLSIVPVGPGAFDIYNVGATGGAADGLIHIDIYLSNSAYTATPTLADRTAYNQFNGITNVGSLYLSVVLVPGLVTTDVVTTIPDETDATLIQRVSSTTLPAIGSGKFYAIVTGGSAFAQWNTNGFNGGAADFLGDFTLRDSGDPNFPGLVNDPIQSLSDAPEPATLALLGLGLAGLALRRRRLVA